MILARHGLERKFNRSLTSFTLRAFCCDCREQASARMFLSQACYLWEVLPFSLDHLKGNDLADDFGSGMMYEIAAPHAWSPPNFPHSEDKAKV
jgi:hypothetical protein